MIKYTIYIVISFLFFSFQATVEKKYYKEYYSDGSLKSKGWKVADQKIGYWYIYHPKGNVLMQGHYRNDKKEGYWYFYSPENKLIKEGHFINNKAEKWWIIYDIANSSTKNQITKKYQYQNNKKNGYCLLYKNDKLFKAEKYINDQKEGEWTDIFSFKKDNPNASL